MSIGFNLTISSAFSKSFPNMWMLCIGPGPLDSARLHVHVSFFHMELTRDWISPRGLMEIFDEVRVS